MDGYVHLKRNVVKSTVINCSTCAHSHFDSKSPSNSASCKLLRNVTILLKRDSYLNYGHSSLSGAKEVVRNSTLFGQIRFNVSVRFCCLIFAFLLPFLAGSCIRTQGNDHELKLSETLSNVIWSQVGFAWFFQPVKFLLSGSQGNSTPYSRLPARSPSLLCNCKMHFLYESGRSPFGAVAYWIVERGNFVESAEERALKFKRDPSPKRGWRFQPLYHLFSVKYGVPYLFSSSIFAPL